MMEGGDAFRGRERVVCGSRVSEGDMRSDGERGGHAV